MYIHTYTQSPIIYIFLFSIVQITSTVWCKYKKSYWRKSYKLTYSKQREHSWTGYMETDQVDLWPQ